jgi:glutamate carboxypeptidase
VSVPAHEWAAVIAGAGVGWIAQINCSDDLASGQLVSVPSQQLAEEMTHWFLGLEPVGADVEVTVTGGMNRPPYQKDAGIADLFGKAQALYREIGKDLLDVPLTGGADGKGAHAAYEQIYFSSLMPRTYLCARLLETLD